MNMSNLLEAWADVVYDLWPDEIVAGTSSRVYFAAIDRRMDADLDNEEAGANPYADPPYVEIMSFDETTSAAGIQALQRIDPKIVVTGTFPADREGPARTIEAQAIRARAYALRDAINARMLAHNRHAAPIDGVGATSRVAWTMQIRPMVDATSGVDEFRLDARLSVFEIDA